MQTQSFFVRHFILAFFLSLFAVPLSAQDDGIFWFNNYADALQEAKRTGKPIFLEYRCEP
jgi:hypothetical protein